MFLFIVEVEAIKDATKILSKKGFKKVIDLGRYKDITIFKKSI